MDHRKCSVPGCTGNADSFYNLPKEPDTRRAWMVFFYEKIPVKFDTFINLLEPFHQRQF